jgi:hypothetical protein
MNAIDILRRGTASYDPHFSDGEIVDPVFQRPFQYGTPYYALCNAVLAALSQGARSQSAAGANRISRAHQALTRALAHVADPDDPPPMTNVDRDLGQSMRINHRDFFWPPILKSYQLLKGLGVDVGDLAETIRGVDAPGAFRSRPPSNWAAVWLLGEWQRIREGLSPHGVAEIDAWLDPFLAGHMDLDAGFYHEPGHPNSYDAFTRYHLAAILSDGYQGRHREALARLMVTGARRSLAVQLSDGSLASAYRSTGLTWTLGVQCSVFTLAANWLDADHPGLAQACRQGARRALASLVRWQPEGRPFSPAENCLPGGYRVGYEGYTTQANHGPLPLGALAMAVANGFDDPPLPKDTPRAPRLWIEHDPVYRAIAHRGPYSAHFNAFPSAKYDGYGLVDLTFGPGRYLQFASSVTSLHGDGRFLNLGLAHKDAPVDRPLAVMAREAHALKGGFQPMETVHETGYAVESRPRGQHHTYAVRVAIRDDGVHIHEATPPLADYKTLLIPYLRDAGRGVETTVAVDGREIRLSHGDEVIGIALDAPIDRVVHLPYGYENRRGLCGLLRVDLAGMREGFGYRVYVVR